MRDHEVRLRHMVDDVALSHDAFYHAQISMLRNWLIVTEQAMEDEEIDSSTITRVLNRLTYATPSGADAHLRIAEFKREVERERVRPPISHTWPI